VLVSISAGDQTVYNISDMVVNPVLAEKRHPSRNPPVKTSDSNEFSFLSDAPSNGCAFSARTGYETH
jgi:hypothetical protein